MAMKMNGPDMIDSFGRWGCRWSLSRANRVALADVAPDLPVELDQLAVDCQRRAHARAGDPRRARWCEIAFVQRPVGQFPGRRRQASRWSQTAASSTEQSRWHDGDPIRARGLSLLPTKILVMSSRDRSTPLLSVGHEAEWAILNEEKRRTLTPPADTPVEELLRRGQHLSAQAAWLLRAVEQANGRAGP